MMSTIEHPCVMVVSDLVGGPSQNGWLRFRHVCVHPKQIYWDTITVEEQKKNQFRLSWDMMSNDNKRTEFIWICKSHKLAMSVLKYIGETLQMKRYTDARVEMCVNDIMITPVNQNTPELLSYDNVKSYFYSKKYDYLEIEVDQLGVIIFDWFDRNHAKWVLKKLNHEFETDVDE